MVIQGRQLPGQNPAYRPTDTFPPMVLKPFVNAVRGIVTFALTSCSPLSLPMVSPQTGSAPHIPVMLPEVLQTLAPMAGETIVDGTFGAGGYTQAILAQADCRVVAFDRDPSAVRRAREMAQSYGSRLSVIEQRFGNMAAALHELGVPSVDGIVLDIGVSSMQIDDASRGFSFLRDGPLDMRMSAQGVSAADIVNALSKEDLANVIFLLGEERRSRAIAGSIVEQRKDNPLRTTFDLVRAVERVTGHQRATDKIHPATRTFQALRIFANAELEELSAVLHAAEELLVPGGRLVVVTFHSLEDRVVKRFLALRSGKRAGASRHLPDTKDDIEPSFQIDGKPHLEASSSEIAVNPRSRSATLRHAVRTTAPAWPATSVDLGVPLLPARPR